LHKTDDGDDDNNNNNNNTTIEILSPTIILLSAKERTSKFLLNVFWSFAINFALLLSFTVHF